MYAKVQSTGQSAVLDEALVNQLRSVPSATGGTLLDELVAMMSGTLPGRMIAIRQTLYAGEPIIAATMAHKVSGSVGTVGARRLADALSRWEARARGGVAIEELLDELLLLGGEVESVETALKALSGANT